MKNRNNLINIVGQEFLITNIENDEFSYRKALKRPFLSEEKHFKLDLRFEKENVSILIETKKRSSNFTKEDENQILSYAKLEREYKKYNDIISILYDLESEEIKVWKNENLLKEETVINSIDYYIGLFTRRLNERNKVLETTNELNIILHSFNISEDQRSQFVGCLLVALNNGLEFFEGLNTKEIINRIKIILERKIENDENKKLKTELLIKILNKQSIKELSPNNFFKLLSMIKNNLIPYIDNKTPQGEDLLNLFFTTFNKYVGKKDKNQAYTPTHITEFMCEITDLSVNSRVLDPTCGSGSFLVQAMSKMISKAGNDEKARENIKKHQLFGIEREEKAFGLATTNMLIHEDGKTNVICDSCFNCKEWIKEKDINIVLMNPPFNSQKMPNDCPVIKTSKMDATKGLYFVNFIADTVGRGMLATILPLQCAIGSDKEIAKYKAKILKNHTLEAVFSLPDEVFHPGASVNTCIMLLKLGIPHNKEKNTFFGYFKEDGFVKKKNKGRVEKLDWNSTKSKWLDAFFNKKEIPGLSVMKNISENDEWLAEAYMETDYSSLSEKDFVQTIRDFLAFKIKCGDLNE